MHGTILTDVRKLHGILDEKNGNVIADDVPITFLGVELDGKASNISDRVCTTTASKHGGEANEDWGGTGRVCENLCMGNIFGRFVDGEGAKRPGTTGMYHSFGDSLVVEAMDLRRHT